MKFALVNGHRAEAEPHRAGKCPGCGSPMIARCGEKRVRHWAHRGDRRCDPWWENETAWHRRWKDRFPPEWQEVVQHADDGERHIADVKTADGWVLEFQHSYLKPEERRSREAFYGKLAWVVDALRRKRDLDQFQNAWATGTPVGANSRLRSASPEGCTLLQEWAETPAPVFFDFGEDQPLGWLLPKTRGGSLYVTPFSREMFVGLHRATATEAANNFHSFVQELSELVANYERHRRTQQRVLGSTARRSIGRRRHRF